MKALYFFEHGPMSNLRFGDVEDPKARTGEVVIRVRACAINHLDLWVLEGWPGLRLDMPHIGGSDIAGDIFEVGKGVTGFKMGDRVVVNPGFATVEDEWTAKGEDSVSPGYKIVGESIRGGFAEYVAVPAKCVHPMSGDDYDRAAAPLLVGVTSWRMLVNRANLLKGETVAIVGAGGGVNSFSIMLAKALGANVIALTSTEEKNRRAKQLGADNVIDYRKIPDWSREIRRLTNGRGADVVVDNVGTATFPQSVASAARGGRIVTVGNTTGPMVSFDNRLVFAKQLSILGSTMGSAADFVDFQKFIAAHNIQAVIDQAIPLKDGKRAYEILEAGTMFGKVILHPE